MSTSLSRSQLEASSWLTNAGQDDTQHRLAAMKGTASDVAVLEHAIAKESASLSPRSSRLKPMEAKLRKFKGSAPAPALTKAVLPSIQKALEATRERLIAAEEVFLNATLADRLKIGLHCFKAHLLFAQKDPAKRGQGRKSGINSRREEISFESWLKDSAPWLKESTAYKYMTAFRGLSLDETADEQLVEDTLTDQRRIALSCELPAPTLASLIAAATQPVEPPKLPPPPHEQLTLDDYLATLKSFREDAEAVIEQAKDMPENLKKAAMARAYSTLAALTGTAWKPSNEHDVLGTIDPDNLAI